MDVEPKIRARIEKRIIAMCDNAEGLTAGVMNNRLRPYDPEIIAPIVADMVTQGVIKERTVRDAKNGKPHSVYYMDVEPPVGEKTLPFSGMKPQDYFDVSFDCGMKSRKFPGKVLNPSELFEVIERQVVRRQKEMAEVWSIARRNGDRVFRVRKCMDLDRPIMEFTNFSMSDVLNIREDTRRTDWRNPKEEDD